MALRAEHHIGLVELHDREEGADRLRPDVAVRVYERDVTAPGFGQPDLQRVPLPPRSGYLSTRIASCGNSSAITTRLVRAPVRDDDDLEGVDRLQLTRKGPSSVR
jgi:hypothetical protein